VTYSSLCRVREVAVYLCSLKIVTFSADPAPPLIY